MLYSILPTMYPIESTREYIVDMGSVFRCIKASYINSFTFIVNKCIPFSKCAFKNSPVTRGVRSGRRLIVDIVPSFTYSKILPPVIKSIHINMVNLFIGRRVHNQPMHVLGADPFQIWIPSLTSCIPRFTTYLIAPFKLANQFIVSVVNQGKLSFSESNFFHNLIILSKFVISNSKFSSANKLTPS